MATYSGYLKKWNATGVAWDTLYPKTTAENIISGTLDAARIPTLDAAKIGTGAFDADRIPTLDASKIGTGTFHVDRIPTLDASKIGSGTIDAGRLPAIALTNSVTYTTLSAFVTAYQANHSLVQAGDVVILTTDKQTYIHNGGSAWTAADLNLLQTPTDVVSSVNGLIGVVTLNGGNVNYTGGTGNTIIDNSTLDDALYSLDHGLDDLNLDLATLSTVVSGKEPAFTKNTGFNKNFGNAVGTVAQGNDSRFMAYTDWLNGKFGATEFDYIQMDGHYINLYADGGEFIAQFNVGGSAHDMKSRQLINVVDPTAAQHVATKNYVDTHQLLLADVLPTTGLVDGQMGFEY